MPFARCLSSRRASPNTSPQSPEESWGQFFVNFVASHTLHASFLWPLFAVVCESFHLSCLSTPTAPFPLDHVQLGTPSTLPRSLAHCPLSPNQTPLLCGSLKWRCFIPHLWGIRQVITWLFMPSISSLSASSLLVTLPPQSVAAHWFFSTPGLPSFELHHPCRQQPQPPSFQVAHLFLHNLHVHSPPFSHSMALFWNSSLLELHHL